LVGGTGGYAKLVFHIDEKETWNSVGWALDELNVDIDDKDVKERSFYIDVARTEDKGFFSSIFGDEAIKKTFQILVRRKDNNVTEVFFNDLTEENEQETIDFSHDFLGSIANLF
jgi:outer membrane protein assembly factor BamC